MQDSKCKYWYYGQEAKLHCGRFKDLGLKVKGKGPVLVIALFT